METKIIIRENWTIVREYDFIFTMTKDDVVYFDGVEYVVHCCLLEVENNTMCILLDA